MVDIVTFYYSRFFETLKQSSIKGTLSGTYILSGIKGLGKRTLVKKIMDEVIPQTEYLSHVYWISPDDEKDEIGIDRIRDIITSLFVKSPIECYKIVCIENAETLSASAGNALLKILEDPPTRTVFFMLDNKTRPMLQTILSRGETHEFFPSSTDKLRLFLQKNNIEHEIIETVVLLCEGKPEDALRLAHDSMLQKERINELREAADAVLSNHFSLKTYVHLTNTANMSWNEKQRNTRTVLNRMVRVLYEAMRVKVGKTSVLSIIEREDNARMHSMNILIEKIYAVLEARRNLSKSVPGGTVLDTILLHPTTYENF